jgi:hypothetical protein
MLHATTHQKQSRWFKDKPSPFVSDGMLDSFSQYSIELFGTVWPEASGSPCV